MKESASYQYMVNKAKMEGLSSVLLLTLNTRFDSIPKTIQDKIKTIDDEQILLESQKLAILAQSKAEFLKAFRALMKT